MANGKAKFIAVKCNTALGLSNGQGWNSNDHFHTLCSFTFYSNPALVPDPSVKVKDGATAPLPSALLEI